VQRKLQAPGKIIFNQMRALFDSTSGDGAQARPERNPALRGRRLREGRFSSTCRTLSSVRCPIMEFHDRMGERVSRRRSGEESAMVRQASHSDGFDAILRANRTVLLGLLWGALFACVAVASVYDVGRWVNLW
jgi:hypothetical protein